MTNYHGACHCQKVKFELFGEPIFVQYCHCNKCRMIAEKSENPEDKCGYSKTAAYLAKNLSITNGQNNLYKRPINHANLYQCDTCHSLIYGISQDPNQQEGIGINLNTIQLPSKTPKAFEVKRHVFYANRTVSIDDNTPKFTDMPKELKGSGKLYTPTAPKTNH